MKISHVCRLITLVLLLTGCGSPPMPNGATVFYDVTVLPMTDSGPQPHQVVVVVDDTIAAIGPVNEVQLPEEFQRIDGQGLFLLPGLVDMHVHNWLEQDHALFLRWGVTTIRNMSGDPRHIRWRDETAAGERLAPFIVTASPVLDGDPPVRPMHRALRSPADASAAIENAVLGRYDLLKVYSVLRPDVFKAILEKAKKDRMHVTGHVPLAVPLENAIAWGLDGVEHFSGFRLAMQAPGSPLTQLSYEEWRDLPRDDLARLVREHLDPQRFDEVVAMNCERGVWNTPTLLAVENILDPPDEVAGLSIDEAKRFVPQMLHALWEPAELSTEERLALEDARHWQKRFAAGLEEAGCGVLLGTDSPGPFTVHGASVHNELEQLVNAGLSPLEALTAATSRPARQLLNDSEIGRVVVGRNADLLLLEANPLEDIRATREIHGVMVQGRWLDRSTLDRMAEKSARFFAKNPRLNPFRPVEIR